MASYIQRLVSIEAVQLTTENLAEVQTFAGASYVTYRESEECTSSGDAEPPFLEVDVMVEGQIETLHHGQVLVRDELGRLFIVKDDFLMYFELVS